MRRAGPSAAWGYRRALGGEALQGKVGQIDAGGRSFAGLCAPAMKQDDATGAGTKKGVGGLGNRRGSENELGTVLRYCVTHDRVPGDGHERSSVCEFADARAGLLLSRRWRLVGRDLIWVRASWGGLGSGGISEILPGPTALGRPAGRDQKEAQQGVSQWW